MEELALAKKFVIFSNNVVLHVAKAMVSLKKKVILFCLDGKCVSGS